MGLFRYQIYRNRFADLRQYIHFMLLRIYDMLFGDGENYSGLLV